MKTITRRHGLWGSGLRLSLCFVSLCFVVAGVGCSPAAQTASSRVPPATCAEWSQRSEGEQLLYTLGFVHGVIGMLTTDQIKKQERGELSPGEAAAVAIEAGENIFPLPAVLGEMKTRCANRPDLKVSAAAFMAIKSVFREPKPTNKKE